MPVISYASTCMKGLGRNMRLDKYLALASVGTRKAVREIVREGKVLVNEVLILEPAFEIDPEQDKIEVQNRMIEKTQKIYYMFHKPAGCVTARTDHKDKTVLEYFHSVQTEGLFPIGRLDKDTEGLLLLTNDGDFNHELMKPEHQIEKTYLFWATGTLSMEEQNSIEEGILLKGEMKPTQRAKLSIEKTGFFKEYQKELLPLLEDTKFEKTDKLVRANRPVLKGMLTITEGRKHQVKRMLQAQGCQVIYLKRISIGRLRLDETLARGSFRNLTQEEIENLK